MSTRSRPPFLRAVQLIKPCTLFAMGVDIQTQEPMPNGRLSIKRYVILLLGTSFVILLIIFSSNLPISRQKGL